MPPELAVAPPVDRRRDPLASRPGGRRWADRDDLRDRFLSLIRSVGRELYDHRCRRGWSLATAADLAGVYKGTLLDLESGMTDPNLSSIVKLADALGCEVVITIRPRR